MSASPEIRPAADLRDCDREPIHVPGSIQPHGALLVLREPDLQVLQVSANAGALLGRGPEELLDRPFDLLRPDDLASLRQLHEQSSLAEVNPLRVETAGGDCFDAIVHRTAGGLVLELEPAPEPAAPGLMGFYHRVRRAAARLESAPDIRALCDAAAEEVRRLTGFDRVMIYRFDPEWNGEVVAEDRAGDVESFLGLHYPATDIPPQARQLYTVNWLRLIADVQYAPTPLVPALNPATGAPLDMSFSVLRSVSPVHVEYLQNMRVGSSMSVSLLHEGRLWGLIALHHRSARFVPYEVRQACEFLGQVLSLHLSLKEEQRDYQQRVQLAEIRTGLRERLEQESDMAQALSQGAELLLRTVNGAGAAVRLFGQVTCVGETPEAAVVARLMHWLDAERPAETFHTDSLSAVLPEAAEWVEHASGILTISLSDRDRIVWFRPEVVRTVNWGGDPNHPVLPKGARIHPRRSFELWKQRVRRKSLPWTDEELRSAAALRGDLVDIFVRRAEQRSRARLEALNQELARSNAELDSFAYVASHDLKEPLRGIRNYTKFVLEDFGDSLPEEGQERLGTVVRLSDRMEELMDSLLHYSRVGRGHLAIQDCDLNLVVAGVLELLEPRIEEKGAEVAVEGPLPVIRCDVSRISEVFANLIGNAIKYNESDRPRVEIGYEGDAQRQEELVFYVRDNGIGIPERHHEGIFEFFRRLHTRDRFGGGTGAGLSIVKRIVERHGGRVWVESAPGEGSAFRFALPVVPASAAFPAAG